MPRQMRLSHPGSWVESAIGDRSVLALPLLAIHSGPRETSGAWRQLEEQGCLPLI